MTQTARPILCTPQMPAPPFRWTALRKLALIQCLRGRPECRAELLSAYGVVEDEVAAWERGFGAHGLIALKVTKLQALRREARS